MEYYFEFNIEPEMHTPNKKIKAQTPFKVLSVMISDDGNNATAYIQSKDGEIDLTIPAYLLQFAKKVGTY